MKITTSTELKVSSEFPDHAQFIVRVFIDGEDVGSHVVMSGKADDVRQFAAGEINMAEVRRRWGMRP